MCSNFHLEVRGEGTGTVLRLYGELDSVSYPVLEEHLRRLRDSGSVIVDLGSLAFMDARGLDALLRARDAAQRRGAQFGVVNAGSQVRWLMKLAGADECGLLLDASERTRPSPGSIGMRDRLLLAFANLNSYGITARPHEPGSVETVHRRVAIWRRMEHPHGLDSYVFWLAADDTRFCSDGNLPAGVQLPLHCGSENVVPAVTAACADVSIEISSDGQDHVLRAREAGDGSAPTR
jgi:anti-anti-sigma factor